MSAPQLINLTRYAASNLYLCSGVSCTLKCASSLLCFLISACSQLDLAVRAFQGKGVALSWLTQLRTAWFTCDKCCAVIIMPSLHCGPYTYTHGIYSHHSINTPLFRSHLSFYNLSTSRVLVHSQLCEAVLLILYSFVCIPSSIACFLLILQVRLASSLCHRRLQNVHHAHGICLLVAWPAVVLRCGPAKVLAAFMTCKTSLCCSH
jgi:hypothetical protein